MKGVWYLIKQDSFVDIHGVMAGIRHAVFMGSLFSNPLYIIEGKILETNLKGSDTYVCLDSGSNIWACLGLCIDCSFLVLRSFGPLDTSPLLKAQASKGHGFLLSKFGGLPFLRISLPWNHSETTVSS